MDGYLASFNPIGPSGTFSVRYQLQDAQEAPTDAQAPYDSVWSSQGVPTQEVSGIEALLLKEDKLYTVLAVVLIIWFGIMLFIFRTDQKLNRLEKQSR